MSRLKNIKKQNVKVRRVAVQVSALMLLQHGANDSQKPLFKHVPRGTSWGQVYIYGVILSITMGFY